MNPVDTSYDIIGTQRSQVIVLARQLVKPLCKATVELITPITCFKDNERVHVSLTEDRKFRVQVYAESNSGGFRYQASHRSADMWLTRIPERNRLNYGHHVLAPTDVSALVLALAVPEENIIFTDDALLEVDALLAVYVEQHVASEHRANFLTTGTMPPLSQHWHDHAELPLLPYQQMLCTTSLFRQSDAFFMEQGTGKTPPAIRRIMIEALYTYQNSERIYRAIVVCPKNVRSNWVNEIKRFSTVPGKVVQLRGGAIGRVKQLIDVMRPDGENHKYSIVVCSYETVRRSWEVLGMIPWDIAIADESHMMKSPWAKRWKDMLKLRDISTSRLLLTGTPMANGVLDLFPQLEFLGEGMSGFDNWKSFKKFYEKYAENEEEGKYTAAQKKLIGFQNLPILQERLARVAFRYTKKEAMPFLPDKIYDVVEAPMSTDQAAVYVKLQKELAVEIENDLANTSNATLTATNILTKLLRLSQITAGYMVIDAQHDEEGNPIVAGKDRIKFFNKVPKLDAAIDIIKNSDPLTKIVIWSCWIPVVQEMSRRMTDLGIKHVVFTGSTSDEDRDAAMRSFNRDPSVKVFIGNPAAGGVGVNLPGYPVELDGKEGDPGTNADHTIYLACNWSFIQRSQSEDRNHGNRRNRVPVQVTDICVPNTIDDEIRARLMSKKEFANTVQDVKEMLVRILNPDLDFSDDEGDD